MDKLGKILCWIGWHDWDMYAGFEQIRVHSKAKCERCGAKYAKDN